MHEYKFGGRVAFVNEELITKITEALTAGKYVTVGSEFEAFGDKVFPITNVEKEEDFVIEIGFMEEMMLKSLFEEIDNLKLLKGDEFDMGKKLFGWNFTCLEDGEEEVIRNMKDYQTVYLHIEGDEYFDCSGKEELMYDDSNAPRNYGEFRWACADVVMELNEAMKEGKKVTFNALKTEDDITRELKEIKINKDGETGCNFTHFTRLSERREHFVEKGYLIPEIEPGQMLGSWNFVDSENNEIQVDEGFHLRVKIE